MDEPCQPQLDVSALQEKCDEYLAGWKRAQADYANLKKDVERERTEFVSYAQRRLLSDLIPAFDQFETALQQTPNLESLSDSDRPRMENWINGIRAVRSLWDSTFQSLGLERVSMDGPFNPHEHEAVGHEPSMEVPEGHVIRCVETGWKLRGMLLRPARVIIASPQSSNT